MNEERLINICVNSKSVNPIEIIEEMMSEPSCPMHGPDHHVMVGAALLTAYKNSGGDVDLKPALQEMNKRGSQVPGGVCGLWGACGAGISTGMFVSIVLKSSPLANEVWRLPNQMTSKALEAISKKGGPRCCKRDSYLAIMEAVKFANENMNGAMEVSHIKCTRSQMNNQCIGKECPFNVNIE